MKRLYIMDSTTITLFKDILRGVGRQPKEGRKKGGIKAHTIIKVSDNVPCLIRYCEAVRHDHMFLQEVHRLLVGSITIFDKGYVDYAQYEAFTKVMCGHACHLDNHACNEHDKTQLSIFQPCVRDSATAHELYQRLPLSGRSRG
ncbi:MAG TPA: transposase [Bacteroidales bacterium]|nr:transposase [Bacteroidales bacterium]